MMITTQRWLLWGLLSLVAVFGGLFATNAFGSTGGAAFTNAPPAPAAAPPSSPTPASQLPPANSREGIKMAQCKLKELGSDPGPCDGYMGNLTGRAFCGWRLIHGHRPTAAPLSDTEFARLWSAKRLPRPRLDKSNPNYIRVSIKCQTLFQVKNGRYRRIMPVSTGKTGKDDKNRATVQTCNGKIRIYRKFGLHESKKHDGWDVAPALDNARMYLPLYLQCGNLGQAIHGEPQRDVSPIQASHGCIRTPLRDQYLLWRESRVGEWVYIS